MTLALSILLLAFGAVLIWGVDYELAGLNVDLVGAILLVVGAVGALLALVAYARGARTERLVRRDYPGR